MHQPLALRLAASVAAALLSACAPADGVAPDDAPAPLADAGADAPDAAPAPPFTRGVSTLAGAADPGLADGPRDVGRFSNPTGVALAADGVLYVADFDSSRIRSVDPTGAVATVLQRPGFQRPFGLALTAGGALYASTDNDDTGAHDPQSGTVWRVDPAARTAVVVARRLGRPRGLAALPDGRLVLADTLHHVIEVLDPATGRAAIVAGRWDVPGMVDAAGGDARFRTPYGVAVRPDGTVAVVDRDNHRVRALDLATGAVWTLAGAGAPGWVDGPAAAAAFAHPQAIAVDAAGALYVTDTDTYRVRRIRGGVVETLAGDGTAGYRDDDDRLAARLFGLEGIAVDAAGATVVVSDGDRGDALPYHRIRRALVPAAAPRPAP